MSTNLVWEIIKNNSSFLRKQVRGNKVTTFSADPMNLTATYSPKYIGVCRKAPVALKTRGNSIVLVTKKSEHENKPFKQNATTAIGSEKTLEKAFENAELTSMKKMAAKRYHALLRNARRAQSIAAKANVTAKKHRAHTRRARQAAKAAKSAQ